MARWIFVRFGFFLSTSEFLISGHSQEKQYATMGVPALFRWLSKKYPKIISPVIEEEAVEIGGIIRPPSYANPNPNGELDNLYLDMNGIVHPCSHPEHKPAPETEDEMMLDVFKYTDRVLNMARPRKILMIAVDGVAPRAKMNQQRSRRFRSAQEAKLANEERERQIAERETRGEQIDLAIKGKKSWDSNAITPGTPFMDTLASALRYWVAYKLASDPGWANLQVIISDATVPGEGEHKIMGFIRSQRSDPEHDPNTSHCIYGLDADLIFLGLATHEPHFRVLREDVFAQDNRSMRLKDQLTITDDMRARIEENDAKKPFLWLHVSILREYLEVELSVPRLPFKFDLERAIDDWVFMCFFVGNDFLPHLPSLDVRDNGIDILINIWKRSLPSLGGYMTKDGHIDLGIVEKLMQQLGTQEDGIFRKRYENERRREDNNKRYKAEREQNAAIRNQFMSSVSKGQDKAPLQPNQNIPLYTPGGQSVGQTHMSNHEVVANRAAVTIANMENKNVAEMLKANLLKKPDSVSAASAVEVKAEDAALPVDVSEASAGDKRTASAISSDSESDLNGDARLWQPGYRRRYYQMKFHTTDEDEIERIRHDMVKCYCEGISWVLLYYYQGCPSWSWYYPYHYAPFAADFEGLAGTKVTFELGKPILPFEQLMSVLPAASGHNLPEIFRPLMSDPNSEIIDFYPEDFAIDMNGKKMSWQGIALLPFIDAQRLLTAVRAQYQFLSEAEKDRNALKHEELFISCHNKNFARFNEELYLKQTTARITFPSSNTGLAGEVYPNELYANTRCMPYKLREGDYEDIPNNAYMRIGYEMPPKAEGKSMLLTGFISHLRAITQEDRDAIMYSGNGGYHRNNRGYQNKVTEDYKKYVGPASESMYGLRVGGYKAFLQLYQQQQQQPVQANYAPSYNNSQGYHSSQGYQSNQGYQHNQNRGGYGGRGRGRGGYHGGSNGHNGGHNGGYNNHNGNRGSYQQSGYQRRDDYRR
ncbi:unnamed protein product [Kuraishia capsulata CBS 1993]|uniref:5'-3' exoribonuclease n=1 Tax=Kuraishia capsulata CBS 1993 TaxID=1382522 RepID=W6MPI3_9ASCO|nr:uncharacterized protein KUCA_T00004220001 [Kuraishia capsulata CBS 1993]CDK28238.1 unnamed protein product [Kuraishia capsulata CBS 1993]